MAQTLADKFLDRLKKERGTRGGASLSKKEGTQFDYGRACGEYQTLELVERWLVETIKGEEVDDID